MHASLLSRRNCTETVVIRRPARTMWGTAQIVPAKAGRK